MGRILRRPETALLVLVGLGFLVAGVFLDHAALVNLGGATVLLPFLLSIAAEVQLAGLKVVRLADNRYQEYVESHKEALGRRAAMLCGEADAPDVLADALAQAYQDLDGHENHELHQHVVCLLVDRALARRRLGLLSVPEDELYGRALLLLQYERFAPEAIARVVERPLAQVEGDLGGVGAAPSTTTTSLIESAPAPPVDVARVVKRAHRRLHRAVLVMLLLVTAAAAALWFVGQSARRAVNRDVAPTLAAEVTGTVTASLSWTVPTDNPATYVVYRDGARIHELRHPTTTYVDAALASRTDYRYEVEVVDRKGVVFRRSDPVEVTTPPPPPVTGVRAVFASGAVTVSWQQPTSPRITAYVVYRNGQRLGSVGKVGEFQDKTLAGGKTYTYAVRAVDVDNHTSAQRTADPVTTPDFTPPSTPSNVAARATSLIGRWSVTLTWTASTDASGIERYEVSRDGAVLGTVSGNVLRFVDTSPNSRAVYSHDYTVVAVDKAGVRSPPSSPVSPSKTTSTTTTTTTTTTTKS